MTKEEIEKLVNSQRKFYTEGKTQAVDVRKENLKKLKNSILKHENDIMDALYKDLGKSSTESYMTEIGMAYSEINYYIKNIKKFCKRKKVRTPISQAISKSFQIAKPYGNVLIMSPWNYPFLLSIDPLAAAITAGNTVILKTSEYSVNTSIVLKKIIEDAFPNELAAVVFGGLEENQFLLSCVFDYIFFTGSKRVGKIVYQSAASKMIPCTLELGGKSPCIVDSSANIELAAKRIVFGKFLNLGQTCVAPDYILCDKSIKDKLIEALIRQIKKQYGNDVFQNNLYGKIINEMHFKRINELIDNDKVVFGGKSDSKENKIEPTILDNVYPEDKIMQEEIFGPILPIMTYDNSNEVVKYVNSRQTPLALYIFSTNKKTTNYFLNSIDFGGGCINDTIIHLATSNMPFGGFKASGIGAYHGKKGFETFSHYSSVVNKSNIIDLPMRYQPYNSKKNKMIRLFLK